MFHVHIQLYTRNTSGGTAFTCITPLEVAVDND